MRCLPWRHRWIEVAGKHRGRTTDVHQRCLREGCSGRRTVTLAGRWTAEQLWPGDVR